jgi:hypothetical protein
MPTVTFKIVKTIRCDRLRQDADLVEERVYSPDPLPDVGRPYQVRACRCSSGDDCNLLGYACRWSYINPDHDPFAAR